MRLPDGVRRLFRLGRVRFDVRREVDEEIDFHLRQSVEHLMGRGLTEEQAHARSRELFGDERAYRVALERIDRGNVRMEQGGEWMDAVIRTLGYAWRGVRRNPGFTLSMVLILALGIGANSVMFGVVDRLLLSPPQHVIDAEDVRLLHVRREIFNGDVSVGSTLTYPDYLDMDEVGAFAAVAAFTEPQGTTVGRGTAARQAEVAGAGAELFPLLGVTAERGRFFTPDEDRVGASPTAVLAHEYWERELGADPEAIGRTIDVGAGRYEVVGVAPPGFTGAILAPVDIWVPLRTAEALENGDQWIENRGWYWLKVVTRLAPDVTTEAAEAEATAMHRAGRAEMIERDSYDAGAEIVAAPIIAARGPRPTSEAQVARWLGGVSLIVLLIACLNAANLLLARAIRTRKEVAVRLALGVSRTRLAAELVTESLTLAVLGAGAALLLAYGLDGPVHQILLPNVAFTDTSLGRRLLLFTATIALTAGLVAGVFPALAATRTGLADALKVGGGGHSGGGSRARLTLLIGQAALSVVLLVGAGLFVRSLSAASELDLGFDQNAVVVARLEWNETLDTPTRQQIYETALAGVRRLPGVTAAGLSYTVPFWSAISLGQPRVPGLDSIPRHHSGGPYVNKVGSGYFEAMGLSIVRGRAFEPADDASGAPPVAIVTESMADAVWPEGNVLGSCLIVGSDEEAPCSTVVGVVENHRRQDLVEEEPHFLYFVNQHHPAFAGPPQAIMARSVGDAEQIVALVRSEAARASSQIRFVEAVPLQERIAPQLRSWRLGASMFSAFGVLALIVAGWGLYSVLAFDVAVRHRELGIRSALGAARERLLRMVLLRALGLVVAGTAIGVLIALGAAPFVQPLLFRVSATDPSVYLLVAVTLVGVAALAGSIPAVRASRVDPREALQTE